MIVSCSGFGFSIAASYRREEKMLMEMSRILSFMECELEYRMTALPQLCREASKQASKNIRAIFLTLSEELEGQISPDAKCCMEAALCSGSEIPRSVRETLTDLGNSLGRFDLSGQLKEITSVKLRCMDALEQLQSHRDERMKNCRTLGICAGVALAILFI